MSRGASADSAMAKVSAKCSIFLSLLGSLLAPGALAKDLVEVQGDCLLLDQALHLGLQADWQDPHQGLGGEPVLGALLVIT